MRDLINSIRAVPAITPAVQSASVNGPAIDLRAAGRGAFVVNTGAIVGSGDFGLKLQESDTTTSADFTDVVANEVATDAPPTLAASSAYRIGYMGYKRYVRLVLTKAGGTSIAAGAVAVLTDLDQRPTI
jgi:hypothetical protein